MRGVENDNSQRIVQWGGWRNALLRRLRCGLWRCGVGGLLRGPRWRCALLRRNRLPPRLHSPRANKYQNEEEEESSAAHSHEDTRINGLRESYTREFQRRRAPEVIPGSARPCDAPCPAAEFPLH